MGGREMNHRFWRENSSHEIARRSRILVRSWRAQCAPQPSPSPEADAAHASESWDLVWSQAAAARCAQEVEAAVWLKFKNQPIIEEGNKDSHDSCRAYKG